MTGLEVLEGPLSLEDRKVRIGVLLEETAMLIGEELIAAKAEHPGHFVEWVTDELPFGIDKAERLMAIARAFTLADPDMRAALPTAYSALFELSRMPTERLKLHIDNGDVGPGTTVREARALNGHQRDDNGSTSAPAAPILPPVSAEPRLSTDILAKELLRQPRSDLSAAVEVNLRRWLG